MNGSLTKNSAPDLRKQPSKRWLGYTVGPPDHEPVAVVTKERDR